MTFVLYRTMSEKECNSYRQVHLLKILGIISFLRSIRISIWYSISCWLQVWEPDHVHHSLQILLIMLLSISELTSSLSFDKNCVHVLAVEWGTASYLHEMFWLWHPLVCHKIALLIFCKSKIVSWWLGEIFRKYMRVICCTSNMQDH